FEAFAAIFLIQMDDYFGVRLRFENMAFGKKQRTEFLIIVNLAVKNDPNGFVFVGKRLVSATQIDDRKMAETQPDRTFHVIPLVVRAAMNDCVSYLFQEIRRDLCFKVKLEFVADSTHLLFSNGSV